MVKEKGKFISLARDFDWELGIWENPDGKNLFSLNRHHKGRRVASITLNKKQLKNLKRFMKERKFK